MNEFIEVDIREDYEGRAISSLWKIIVLISHACKFHCPRRHRQNHKFDFRLTPVTE